MHYRDRNAEGEVESARARARGLAPRTSRLGPGTGRGWCTTLLDMRAAPRRASCLAAGSLLELENATERRARLLDFLLRANEPVLGRGPAASGHKNG